MLKSFAVFIKLQKPENFFLKAFEIISYSNLLVASYLIYLINFYYGDHHPYSSS